MKRLITVLILALALTVPALAVDETDTSSTSESVLYSIVVSAEETETETSDETSTLKDTLTALFGPYEPRTQTVTDYLSDGTSVTYSQIIPGLAGLDYEWISSVVLFGLMMFCVLKLLGGVSK